jgi:hypothetical protein
MLVPSIVFIDLTQFFLLLIQFYTYHSLIYLDLVIPTLTISPTLLFISPDPQSISEEIRILHLIILSVIFIHLFIV